MDVWSQLQATLRKLRGKNLWRGTETVILPKSQMRLYQESRGHLLGYKYFVIHLTSEFDKLWAEEFPGGRKRAVATDYAGDWEAWLGAIVAECRGAAYLHTRSEKADYRQV